MSRKRSNPETNAQRKIAGMRQVEVTKNPITERKAQLERFVFGQPQAAEAVAQAIIRYEADMNDPNRPIGIFLFLGPTGVGKTEMSRAIAKVVLGNDSPANFLKLDMSEFSAEHTIARLIGSPPGYIGAKETVAIPHAWLNRPEIKVLVLDEFEKASRGVHRFFLSAMEDGKAEARNGTKGIQTLYFNNTIIVCTSNAGSSEMNERLNHKALGFTGMLKNAPDTKDAEIERAGKKALSRHFSPELLRRMDAVVFRHLKKEQYPQILNKFLEERNARNLSARVPTLSLSKEVRAHLVELAWAHKDQGGSSIRDVFERVIISQASALFLDGAVQYDEIIRFELIDGQLKMFAKPNPHAKKGMTLADLPQDMLAEMTVLMGGSGSGNGLPLEKHLRKAQRQKNKKPSTDSGKNPFINRKKPPTR